MLGNFAKWPERRHGTGYRRQLPQPLHCRGASYRPIPKVQPIPFIRLLSTPARRTTRVTAAGLHAQTKNGNLLRGRWFSLRKARKRRPEKNKFRTTFSARWNERQIKAKQRALLRADSSAETWTQEEVVKSHCPCRGVCLESGSPHATFQEEDEQ